MIIYSPEGMPIFVPSDSIAKTLIESLGYKLHLSTKINPIKVDSSKEPQASDNTLRINLQTVTTSELIKLDSIGISKAKKVIEKRDSIKSIEDLFIIIPEVDWYNLSSKGEPVLLEIGSDAG